MSCTIPGSCIVRYDACRCQSLVKRMSSRKLQELLSPNLDKHLTLSKRHLQPPTLVLYQILDEHMTLSKRHLRQPTLLLYQTLDKQVLLREMRLQQPTLVLYRLLYRQVTLGKKHLRQRTLLLCRVKLPGSTTSPLNLKLQAPR